MGWLRTLFLGDIGNRLDIEDAEREIERVRRANSQTRSLMSSSSATIRGLRKEVKTLRNESEKQKLAIEALTRFLVEEKIVDQRKLEDFIVDVDAEDGIVDGKLAIDPTNGRLQLNANPPQKETEFKGHRIRILR